MSTHRRGGFTLIELLVSLVMLILVATAMFSTLTTMQRVTRRQTGVAQMQGSLRSGLQLIQTELQEIATNNAAATSDIRSLSATAVRYRAMRGIGESCEVSATGVKIRQSSYNGLHAPTTGRDGLLLFLEGADSTLTTDDSWLELTPIVVTASNCPDGDAAWTVTTPVATPALAWVPGPIRTYEEMAIGFKTDAGQNWLGIRSLGLGEAELIPVVGPLDANGVGFLYYDVDGNETATASAVASIVITLRGVTDRTVNVGVGSTLAIATDSLSVRVQLRNSR